MIDETISIPNQVSIFVQQMMPDFYASQGGNGGFLAFLEAYYEFLESSGQVLNVSRNMLSYRDIDTTLDQFLSHFIQTYLYGIPNNLKTNKAFLVKHILDVYRSKGTIQGFKLLFRLLYNEDIEVYLPQKDILKASDGDWYAPYYLEIADNPMNDSLLGQIIQGSSSGTQAAVQNFVRQVVKQRIVNILIISNITGDGFTPGEKVLPRDLINSAAELDAPTIIGSVAGLQMVSGGQGFIIGDTIVGTNGSGDYSQFRVTGVANGTGTLLYTIVNGGQKYSVDAIPILTRQDDPPSGVGGSFKVGGISNVSLMTICDDIIIDKQNVLLDAANYNFNGNVVVNATSGTLEDALTFTTKNFGTIKALTFQATGNNYHLSPTVTVRDLISTGNQAGFAFCNTSSNVVIGVNTTFTSLFVANSVDPIARYFSFNITTDNILYMDHRIVTSVVNDTYMTLDDYPTANNDGRIHSIAIANAGSGYTNASIVTITPAVGDTTGSGASAFITANSTGAITGCYINAAGYHYTAIPSVTVSGGSGANLVAQMDFGAYQLSVPALEANFPLSELEDGNGNLAGNDAIITATPQFGTGIIANVEVKNSGYGYTPLEPLICATYGAVSNIVIENGGRGYANNDELVFSGGAPIRIATGSALTDSNGTITGVNLIYEGSGYQTTPTILVNSETGSGAKFSCDVNGLSFLYLIEGFVEFGGEGKSLGKWRGTKGFLNSNKYLQDSYYYQDYSYEIQSSLALETYADILRQVAHPAGNELFGRFVKVDNMSMAASEVSITITQNTDAITDSANAAVADAASNAIYQG